MIPRYRPTYTYRDLLKSYQDSFSSQVSLELKRKLKQYFGKRHAFLFYNGKTAITVLLKSMASHGVVLTPAYNCIAVPQAILAAGLTPRFVDARPGRLDVDPYDFRNAIDSDIRFLMPVHLFGIPWGTDKLSKLCSETRLPIIEDAAPAFGARRNGQLVGVDGDAMILSFHWTKPISGETGGAILTDDDDLASRIYRVARTAKIPRNRNLLFMKTWLRKSICFPCVFGAARYGHRLLFGERMFEVVDNKVSANETNLHAMSLFSCALVLNQMDRFDGYCRQRRIAAGIYQRELQQNRLITLPDIPADCEPSWTQYPLLVQEKKAFFYYMQQHGIDVTWSYRYSCPDTYHMNGFENSGRVARQIVSLPTWPGLRTEEITRIGQIAASFSGS